MLPIGIPSAVNQGPIPWELALARLSGVLRLALRLAVRQVQWGQ